jgi:hypothetical protein
MTARGSYTKERISNMMRSLTASLYEVSWFFTKDLESEKLRVKFRVKLT